MFEHDGAMFSEPSALDVFVVEMALVTSSTAGGLHLVFLNAVLLNEYLFLQFVLVGWMWCEVPVEFDVATFVVFSCCTSELDVWLSYRIVSEFVQYFPKVVG